MGADHFDGAGGWLDELVVDCPQLDGDALGGDSVAEPAVDPPFGGGQDRDGLRTLLGVVQLGGHHAVQVSLAAVGRKDGDLGEGGGVDEPTGNGELGGEGPGGPAEGSLGEGAV